MAVEMACDKVAHLAFLTALRLVAVLAARKAARLIAKRAAQTVAQTGGQKVLHLVDATVAM